MNFLVNFIQFSIFFISRRIFEFFDFRTFRILRIFHFFEFPIFHFSIIFFFFLFLIRLFAFRKVLKYEKFEPPPVSSLSSHNLNKSPTDFESPLQDLNLDLMTEMQDIINKKPSPFHQPPKVNRQVSPLNYITFIFVCLFLFYQCFV